MNLSLGVMDPIHVVCDAWMVSLWRSMRVSGTVMGRAMPSGGLSAIATELLVQRSFGIVDRNWYLCAEAEPLWGTSDEEFEAGAIVREAQEEAGFDLEDRDFTWNNGRPMRTVDKDRN